MALDRKIDCPEQICNMTVSCAARDRDETTHKYRSKGNRAMDDGIVPDRLFCDKSLFACSVSAKNLEWDDAHKRKRR